MCRVLVSGRYRGLAPTVASIYHIDPECYDCDEDLDLNSLFGETEVRRCDLCPKKVSKRCDKVICCMTESFVSC